MELKTLKKLLIGISMLVGGIVLFSVGIIYSIPVVGLLGTALTIFGAIDTGDYIRQGIKEKIEYNKFCKQRKKEIAEKNKQKQAEKNLVVSDFKKEEICDKNENTECKQEQINVDTNSQDEQQLL